MKQDFTIENVEQVIFARGIEGVSYNYLWRVFGQGKATLKKIRSFFRSTIENLILNKKIIRCGTLRTRIFIHTNAFIDFYIEHIEGLDPEDSAPKPQAQEEPQQSQTSLFTEESQREVTEESEREDGPTITNTVILPSRIELLANHRSIQVLCEHHPVAVGVLDIGLAAVAHHLRKEGHRVVLVEAWRINTNYNLS